MTNSSPVHRASALRRRVALVLGVPLAGVLLWLVSLVCGGLGVLVGRGRTN